MSASNNRNKGGLIMRRLISETMLVAEESPREAFYQLLLEELPADGYLIRKISGTKDAILHEESYHRESEVAAMELVEAKIRSKTSPARKGPRRYRLLYQRTRGRRLVGRAVQSLS